MGFLSDFVVCLPDDLEQAIAALDLWDYRNPPDAHGGRFRILALRGLTQLELDDLAAAFGVEDAVERVERTQWIGEESWVYAFPAELVTRLASMTDAELRHGGQAWVDAWARSLETTAHDGVVPDTAAPSLDGQWGWWSALVSIRSRALFADANGLRVFVRVRL